MNDWTVYGRVDADGTVYVKTAAGERAVGSWKAGTPEEGLAHFARRFADLVTEVDLIEARLASGAADAAHTVASLRRLRKSLDDAHVVGDLDGLASRVEKLTGVAEDRAGHVRAAREVARGEALARKTALVEEAERIAEESTRWKAAGDRLREILDEWKAIQGVDKKADGELWKRYSAARDSFNRRRGTHFASLDAQRKQASSRKEELVAEAETLAGSSEWTATANRLKELMAEWKAAPRAAKEVEQGLWERFRAAQDAFFNRRSEVFSARDTEQKASLQRKQELLAEAEAIDVDADVRAAQAKLREIQAQWQDAGRLPREVAAGLDRRMRAVEEKLRSAMESAWRRTPPESSPLLAQIREQVAEAEARLARAHASGDARRIREAQEALETKRRFMGFAIPAGSHVVEELKPSLPLHAHAAKVPSLRQAVARADSWPATEQSGQKRTSLTSRDEIVQSLIGEPPAPWIPTEVYLDTDDPVLVRAVLEIVDRLAELLGYEGPVDEEILRGSVWRRAKAVLKTAANSDEVRQRLLKVERALELVTIDERQADVDGKEAVAVAQLVASLKDVPQAQYR